MHRAITLLLAITAPWLCPSAASQTPPDASLRKIVLIGDDAPGLEDGVTVSAIGGLPNLFAQQPDVVMDVDGEVAFFALVQGPGIIGGEVEGANSVTLWREVDGVLSLVVQQGDPIPGSPGQTFTGFPDVAPFPGFALAEIPDIRAGRVVFSATGGLYVHTGAALAPVDLVTPPVGLPPTSSIASLIVGAPHAEPDGSVLFVAQYDVPFAPEAVACMVRGRTDAPAEVLLAEGLPAPDIDLPPDVVLSLIATFPSSAGPGFAFAEDTTDAFILLVRFSGPGITNANDEALLMYENGGFRLAALEGSPAPGVGNGGTWGFFSSGTTFQLSMPPRVNAQGQVAFSGDFTGGVAPGAAGLGLWTDRSGELQNVLIGDEICTSNPGGPFGDPVPGMPDFAFSSFSGGDFNDAGQIALIASVSDSTIPPFAACLDQHTVLVTDLSGELAVALERHVRVPGHEAVLSAFLEPPRLTHSDHALVGMLVTGPGITSSNDRWVVTLDPDGVVRPVLREGDLVDLGSGDVRTISAVVLGRGISSADEVPATLSFTDGSGGVFALSVTDSWADLGGGTAGVQGVPLLVGDSSLQPLSSLTLSLTQGPPDEFILLWMSFTSAPINALGGTIHAVPFFEQVLLSTDPAGAFVGGTQVPPGIPTGTELYFQFICQDLTVIDNLTLSNAVRATFP